MKEVNLKIQFTNRWLYSFFALGLFVICVLGVYAYNSGASPAVMGHSGEEIQVSVNGQSGSLNNILEEVANRERGIECQTFEFDALDASSYRYFEFTLPFDCAHPENGGEGCTWRLSAINSAGTIPTYSTVGFFNILNEGSTWTLNTFYSALASATSVISDSTNSDLQIRTTYDDGLTCRIYDSIYDGSWHNDEGEPYNQFGARVRNGYKAYLQICELTSSNDLISIDSITYG